MKNMDKGRTVPKWMLIVWPKIPQIPQNLSAQSVRPGPKVWASVVRATCQPNGKTVGLQ